MIERTEITVELDSKDIATALRDYVNRKGVTTPTHVRIEITAGGNSYPISRSADTALYAVLTVKNGSKPVEDTI